LCCWIVILAVPVAYAQRWPLPAATPNTDVTYTGGVSTDPRLGLKTIGYPAQLGYVGRFADAESYKDIQFPLRTLRPRMARIAPERHRIYMILGSTVAAYNLESFFSRVTAQEQLTSPGGREAQYGPPEVYLPWDRSFYAESSGWKADFQDGQDRLFGIDWDDRNYVYVAYDKFGWGILQDDLTSGGGALPSVYQYPGGAIGDLYPDKVVCVKTGSSYYAFVSSPSDPSKLQVWNVTNASAPVKQPDQVGRSMFKFAKDADGSHIAVVEYAGSLKIFTPDQMARGAQPVKTFVPGQGAYKGVDSDGTNFYGVGGDDTGPFISVITPNASGSYDEVRYRTGVYYGVPNGIHAGAGFLTTFGSEQTYGNPAQSGSWNVRLYNLQNNVPVEVSLDAVVPLSDGTRPPGAALKPFFTMYYAASPEGYTHPSFKNILDAPIYKLNSKVYLILETYGLGDVWQLKTASGDALTARLVSTSTTPNPHSDAPAGSGPFYGDQQTFSSALVSGNPVPVAWNFGDGTPDGHAPAGSPTITHQFAIAPATALPKTFTVTATNENDHSVSDTLHVTINKPASRYALFAANGTRALLFKQADASAPAAVTSDFFGDSSDGAVEGHFTEWALDNASSTKQLPANFFSVGTCGAHALSAFLPHFGQYTGSGATLQSTGTDLSTPPVAPYNIPLAYQSLPFVVSVQEPSPSTASDPTAVFAANVRTTAALPSTTACTYLWQVVGANNAILASAGGPTSTAQLGSVPTFSVQRSLFNTAGSKVRLSVSVDPAVLASGCSSFATDVSTTNALNGPGAQTIVATGCDNAGSPCTLTPAAAEQSGFSYQWSVSGGPAAVAGANTYAFNPAITLAGTYTFALTVTNSIGSATATPKTITFAVPVCASNPTEFNSAIGYSGAASGCNSKFTTCTAGETITYRVFTTVGITACDTFQWSFGDGATSTDQTATHTYASNGQYTVSLLWKVGGATKLTLTADGALTVGSVIQQPPPPPPPPPPGGCALQTADSAYVGYVGSQSACSAAGGNNCKTSERIDFGAYTTSYNFDCSTASYAWNFGDNTSSSERFAQHTYATPGTYHVSVTITNSAGSGTYSATVPVGGTGVPVTCGTLSDQTLSFSYNGSGCSNGSGDCNSGSAVGFAAAGIGGYDLSCGAHTYDWDFGDSSAHGNGTNPTHTYANAGTYSVKMKVGYGQSSFTVTRSVSVITPRGGGGNCPVMVDQQNVYIVYYDPSNLCSNSGGNCAIGENVQFKAFFYNYDTSCAAHTYAWDFGDGGKSTEKEPVHSFALSGTYHVKLTVTNPKQSIDFVKTVAVGTGISTPVVPRGGHAVRH
jgi:PKD repeat protein